MYLSVTYRDNAIAARSDPGYELKINDESLFDSPEAPETAFATVAFRRTRTVLKRLL